MDPSDSFKWLNSPLKYPIKSSGLYIYDELTPDTTELILYHSVLY